MKELFIGIGIAAVSGSCLLAYSHPESYKSLARTIGSALIWITVIGIVFLTFGSWYVAVFEDVVGKEVVAKINEAASKRVGTVASRWFGAVIPISLYGLFLWRFVSRLKQPKSEVDKG